MGMFLIPKNTAGYVTKEANKLGGGIDPKPFVTRATNCFFKEEVRFTVYIEGVKYIGFKRLAERGEPGKNHDWVLLVPEGNVQYG